jgi:hypothetical protein
MGAKAAWIWLVALFGAGGAGVDLAEPRSARGGFDLAALAALEGRERRLAEQRLSRRFERECAKAQAAYAAGDENWRGDLLIATAAALWRVAPQERCARVLIGRLRFARARAERMDAAAALAEMPTAEVARALNEALDDRDALVRHHAARALLAIHGVEIDPRAGQSMVHRVMAGEAERRETGRRNIAAAVARNPLPRWVNPVLARV